MASQKYNPPSDAPPPPTYAESSLPSPAPAHVPPQHNIPQHDGYGPPQGGYGGPPGFGGPPPPQQQFPPHEGGAYYAPGPQMGYAQQPQGQYYGHPGPYGPQGGYGPQGYGGGYAPGYGPQGQYLDDRRGRGPGFMEAFLASLACCCCLDCLLF